MRISVECGGYAEAAAVCRTANHVSALLTESLAGKIGGYAGMAGDDATSSDFAAAYDPAAREAVSALTDLTHALIGLGRLVDASGRNHDRAEVAAARRTSAYVGGGLDEESYVRVSPAAPPSSLGGSVAPGLGDVHAWILDQVEGFVWPGADVGLLRDAASAWRRTSGSVADLTAHLDVVAGLLERQVSPEIPLALAAIADLRSLVSDVGYQLLALAEACDDYATAVDDTRERTRALLTEIGQMVIEEVALTVVVTGLTGGFGGGAKALAALARIRAQAPRFHALLVSLRVVVASACILSATLLTLALWPAPALWQAVSLLLIIGIASPGSLVLHAHARSTLPERLVGRGMTLQNMAAMGGIFLLQWASGGIIGLFEPESGATPEAAYRAAFGFLGVMLLLSLAVYAGAKDVKPGETAGAGRAA